METVTARHLLAVAARAQAAGRLPSLVAGVVVDGTLAWSAGRGRVDGAAPGPDTQYAIGSITKTFTAVLVMRLRDEGLVRLDDPVETHVTDVPLPGRTVGQLLAQTGGLAAEPPGPWWERVDGPGWSDLAAGIGSEDLLHPAGRRFHYSNLGYGVLGRLVEVHRGAPWEACLEREVLRPLGLRRTTVRPQAPAAPGLAVHPWADLVLSEPTPEYAAMAPAGALRSTLDDLAIWARFLLGETGEVLAPATLEEMLAPGGVDASVPDWSSYGLGLQLHRAEGRTLVGHGGSVPGYVAGLLVDRDERTAAVAAANVTRGELATALVGLLGTLREHEPRIADEWRPATSALPTPVELLGIWYWGAQPFALRAVPDGGLHLSPAAGTGPAGRFTPDPDGGWRGLDGYHAGESMRAVRDAAGTVTHLDVGTFVFTRAPYEGTQVPGGMSEGGWRPAGSEGG